MYYEQKENVTVKTILDTRQENKEGTYPIRVEIIYRRSQRYINTGKRLTEAQWYKLPTIRSGDLTRIRKSIKNTFDKILAVVESLVDKGEFNFERLDRELDRAPVGTLNECFEYKIKTLAREEQIGTMLYYQGILYDLEKFAGKEIPLDIITPEWLRKYERHMLKTKRQTTISMYMRGIRAMMNFAIRQKLIKETHYPFSKNGGYVIKTVRGRKKGLTDAQLKLIAEFTGDYEAINHYRDLWLFLYMANGINVLDMILLKYMDMVDGEIHYIRSKTWRTTKEVKEIVIPVTDEMMQIIQNWGNPPSARGYIFPFLKGDEDALQIKKKAQDVTRRINRHMGIIGKELRLGKITTMTARHTFATVLKRGGAAISYISESLGHTSQETTENYLAAFQKEERQKNAEILTRFNKS